MIVQQARYLAFGLLFLLPPHAVETFRLVPLLFRLSITQHNALDRIRHKVIYAATTPG